MRASITIFVAALAGLGLAAPAVQSEKRWSEEYAKDHLAATWLKKHGAPSWFPESYGPGNDE
ncbi:hypothetical protein DCS_03475 [Drechmeria coniospora]|uniref:Uncharacterized protein n=1 Tax=Drechmeria coniospora TaxID=98403 RepID=A0A151GH84_DRECN|nr:hypothetical protein DCS_03475 [Drechmeria coniospora]KYK56475.1 hypothetical protein DCS_03475 [Drechmeria coniospora]